MQEQNDKKKTVTIDDLREAAKGELKLAEPMRAGDKDIWALKYDFVGLSGAAIMDVLDRYSNPKKDSMFGISHMQALGLFAATAEKCNDGIDEKDVMDRLGAVDAVAAKDLARLFMNASYRVERKNS